MNAPGIVRTQAHITRPATPQRTADRRWVVPTPTIAPEIVWVVDTGTPPKVASPSEIAAARLGGHASDRLELRDLRAHRVHDPPAAEQRAEPDRRVRGQHDPQRARPTLATASRSRSTRVRMTPIVFCASLPPWPRLNAAAENSWPPAEPPVQLVHLPVPVEHPEHARHERERQQEPDHRGDHDEHGDLLILRDDQRAPTHLRDRRARETADERVRGGGRQAESPGDQVPADRADQRGEDRGVVERPRQVTLAIVSATLVPKKMNAAKLKKAAHATACFGRQHARRHDGRDRVRGVVEAVDVVERRARRR